MPHRVKFSDITKVLSSNGFVLVSQSGSHQKWRNPSTGATTIVPVHNGRQIPIGTTMSIIKASKLDKSLFGF